MYILAQWKKEDPVVRWSLPDRIFFGHGACHILAGVFLHEQIDDAFKPFWIRPSGHPGNHIFVSDGQIAFDYHGYSALERLKDHHWKVWTRQYSGWSAEIEQVDFDLLDTSELNLRNMRGPDQYHGDAVVRAHRFLQRVDHKRASARARRLAFGPVT